MFGCKGGSCKWLLATARKKNPTLRVKICDYEPFMTPHPNMPHCSAATTLNVDIHPPYSHDSPSTASSDLSFCLFCQPCRRLGKAMLDKVVEKRVISAAWNLICLPGPQPIVPASSSFLLADWLVGGNWPISRPVERRKWRRNKNIYLVFLHKLVGWINWTLPNFRFANKTMTCKVFWYDKWLPLKGQNITFIQTSSNEQWLLSV